MTCLIHFQIFKSNVKVKANGDSWKQFVLFALLQQAYGNNGKDTQFTKKTVIWVSFHFGSLQLYKDNDYNNYPDRNCSKFCLYIITHFSLFVFTI